MKTLIKNGMILTTENEFKSDILIVDEKIAAIGKISPKKVSIKSLTQKENMYSLAVLTSMYIILSYIRAVK